MRSKESLEWSWWVRVRGDGGEWVMDWMLGDFLFDGVGVVLKVK